MKAASRGRSETCELHRVVGSGRLGCAFDKVEYSCRSRPANFRTAGVNGPCPAELSKDSETTVLEKANVIEWLKRMGGDREDVTHAWLSAELGKSVKAVNRNASLASAYLRIIVHSKEHMSILWPIRA